MPALTTTLRPETEEDTPFLLALYASTREEELALTEWTDEQKDAFIRSQFGFQRQHYRAYFADASFDVILIDGLCAGRLYIHRQPKSIHILDIALIPEYRRRGVGRALLESLQQEAAGAGKEILIHVERFNPALHLYERLGFQNVGEQGPVYLEMKWSAGSTP